MNQTAFNFSPPPRPADPATRALQTLRQDPLAFSFVTEGWLLKNQQVWIEFYKAVNRLRSAGNRRYGAKAIYEHLRYESSVADSEKTFKLNNSYVSGLARLYNAIENVEFFETRETA